MISNINLSALCGCELNNLVWFADNSSNGLYCLNPESKNITYYGMFPDEGWEAFLFKCCLNYKGKLVFIPENASFVHVFDTREKKFVQAFDISKFINVNGSKVAGAFVFGGKIWLFPSR